MKEIAEQSIDKIEEIKKLLTEVQKHLEDGKFDQSEKKMYEISNAISDQYYTIRKLHRPLKKG